MHAARARCSWPKHLKEAMPGSLCIVVVHGGLLAGRQVRYIVPGKATNLAPHLRLELRHFLDLQSVGIAVSSGPTQTSFLASTGFSAVMSMISCRSGRSNPGLRGNSLTPVTMKSLLRCCLMCRSILSSSRISSAMSSPVSSFTWSGHLRSCHARQIGIRSNTEAYCTPVRHSPTVRQGCLTAGRHFSRHRTECDV